MKKRKIKYGVAKDGVEAVNKWQTGGFHLILVRRAVGRRRLLRREY